MRRTAAVALAVLCAGCAVGDAGTGAAPASTSAPVEPAVPPVPGIEAEAVQLRTDVPIGGQFQVRITATGDEPFTVSAVALDSAGFAPLPPTDDVAEFAPGRVIDLPTPFGPPRCDAPAEPAVAEVTLERPGAAPERVRLPLAAEVLGDIHADECAEIALGEVVAVEVVDLVPDGDGLSGALTLTRRSGEDEVRVVRLSRSVLLDVDAELPAVLAGSEADGEVALRFTLATCDAHVLAETKQPFRFPLAVEVGDDEAVTLDLPLSKSTESQLAELVQRVCTARNG